VERGLPPSLEELWRDRPDALELGPVAAFQLCAVFHGGIWPEKIAVDGGVCGWLFVQLSTDNTRHFTMSIEIKMRKNEPIDRALRRMKKKLDRENIIKDVRAKRYYEKPCERRRRKDKVAAFTAMLRARYAN
jgi:small subunit ribosomal protein S21